MTLRATYRLQVHKDFGFDKAAEIAPYLLSLGITNVYASAWMTAAPGSLHGYDIVDHHALNPETRRPGPVRPNGGDGDTTTSEWLAPAPWFRS